MGRVVGVFCVAGGGYFGAEGGKRVDAEGRCEGEDAMVGEGGGKCGDRAGVVSFHWAVGGG